MYRYKRRIPGIIRYTLSEREGPLNSLLHCFVAFPFGFTCNVIDAWGGHQCYMNDIRCTMTHFSHQVEPGVIRGNDRVILSRWQETLWQKVCFKGIKVILFPLDTGDPAPTMFWIQPSGISRRYEAPQDEDARHNEGVLTLNPDGTTRDLSGMYICLAYNAAGNVTLTMNVAWPGKMASIQGTSPPEGGYTDDEQDHHKHTHSRSHNHGKIESTHVQSNQADSPSNGHTISKDSPNEDGSKKDINANNVAKGNDKSYNFTALNMMDLHKKKGERLFNLTELVGAIIGTHVCTLLLCLIFMPLYLKRQWKKRRHQNQGLEKNTTETLYLNGRGIPDYLDTPTLTHKR